jgi:integrase
VNCIWPVLCPDQMEILGKGARAATIPVTPRAQEARNRLGSWPIGARAPQRRFEKAGIHPHQCRHWRGTSMAESGADLGDIQDMLRHASPATTLGYAAWSVDRVRTAPDRVHG